MVLDLLHLEEHCNCYQPKQGPVVIHKNLEQALQKLHLAVQAQLVLLEEIHMNPGWPDFPAGEPWVIHSCHQQIEYWPVETRNWKVQN